MSEGLPHGKGILESKLCKTCYNGNFEAGAYDGEGTLRLIDQGIVIFGILKKMLSLALPLIITPEGARKTNFNQK